MTAGSQRFTVSTRAGASVAFALPERPTVNRSDITV
jgi:hypothetical protein